MQTYYYLFLLFLVACHADPLALKPSESDSFAIYGTFGVNPKYPDAAEDEEPYIVTWNNLTDTLPSGIGLYLKENCVLFLSTCRYVFDSTKLDAMHLIGGAECEDWSIVPHRIEVASERHQFLIFDPDDGFWECWDLAESSRVEGSFSIWVRENETCPE